MSSRDVNSRSAVATFPRRIDEVDTMLSARTFAHSRSFSLIANAMEVGT